MSLAHHHRLYQPVPSNCNKPLDRSKRDFRKPTHVIRVTLVGIGLISTRHRLSYINGISLGRFRYHWLSIPRATRTIFSAIPGGIIVRRAVVIYGENAVFAVVAISITFVVVSKAIVGVVVTGEEEVRSFFRSYRGGEGAVSEDEREECDERSGEVHAEDEEGWGGRGCA